MLSSERPLHIRAVIPHFYRESAEHEPVLIGEGFGSRRPGSRWLRAAAFQRCLCGLLNLRRSSQDLSLDLRHAKAMLTPIANVRPGFPEITLEIVVLVVQDAFLMEVIRSVLPQARLLKVDINDPRELGFAARDWLIQHPNPADLNLYLEDDLVINDPLLPEKILWMAAESNDKCVLLPHRYELTRRPGSEPRLYIDGPIDVDNFTDWHQPFVSFANGNFQGQQRVYFDVPINPHAGFFGISRSQVLYLKEKNLPTQGFVGPLESAATLTVGKYLTILKSSLGMRSFLEIEHAYPSYIGYLREASTELS